MMESNTDVVLMDRERIERTLKRMAHEIAERNKENNPILLFGINERGNVIASDLADILRPIFEENVQVVPLPIKKDGSDQVFEQLEISTARKSFLVAVDDVIFSGHTMFTALKKIANYINPAEIHSAVLIDRGHRKFPIKAEFCGMNLPTKRNEHVSVIVKNRNVEEVILNKL